MSHSYAPRVQRAVDALAAAKAELDRAVASQQASCRHVDLIECDYMPMYGGSALPPMRLCRTCGMTEDGWGCGHIVLKGAAVRASRDAVYAGRLGLHISDEEKGPLLRGEVTVAELVTKKLGLAGATDEEAGGQASEVAQRFEVISIKHLAGLVVLQTLGDERVQPPLESGGLVTLALAQDTRLPPAVPALDAAFSESIRARDAAATKVVGYLTERGQFYGSLQAMPKHEHATARPLTFAQGESA